MHEVNLKPQPNCIPIAVAFRKFETDLGQG